MTDRSSGSRGWRPPSRRSIVTAAAAAAVGLAAGFLINALSPNPVYGIQLIADVIVIGIVVIVALLPPARRFLPLAIGFAAGVIAAVAIGTAAKAPSGQTVGTVQIVLAQPQVTTMSAPAVCLVTDGVLQSLSTSDAADARLTDGRTLALGIGPAEQEPIDTEHPLGIDLRIGSTVADGSPSATRMVSVATSDVTIVNDGVTGSLTFAGLVLHDLSEQREPIPVEGIVTWSCPAAP